MRAGVRKPLQIDEELVTLGSFTRKAVKLVHSRSSLVSPAPIAKAYIQQYSSLLSEMCLQTLAPSLDLRRAMRP